MRIVLITQRVLVMLHVRVNCAIASKCVRDYSVVSASHIASTSKSCLMLLIYNKKLIDDTCRDY